MQQSKRLQSYGTVEQEEPLIQGDHSYGTLTTKINSIPFVPLRRTPIGWLLLFSLSFLLLMVFFAAVTYLLIQGVGIWGINIPVGWGLDIVNFVWWIGIGHAGTLISAVLLLLRQPWRNSINRLSEAMTIFAVACAGLFPILHLGRIWLFYWLLPYPNNLGMWPMFRSPLTWDVFAVSTYGTVSLLFWLVGLIPDFASLRDQAPNRARRLIYGALALGWRGAGKHWQRYEMAYLLLAGLATPLVVSVHSIVALDFSVSQVPGWHTTFFPPYFVAGAIFSGFAMVLTLIIPIRKYYGLKDFVTDRHLDFMAKVMLTTGLIVFYGYMAEIFYAWYSGNEYERFMVWNRMTGPYAPAYWALIACNGIIPQLLWFRRFRSNVPLLFVVSLIINIGMWLERFVIIVISLHRDYLPSAWHMYTPTIWDWATYIGTIGLFFTLLFLFLRFLPIINVFEMRHLLHEEHEAAHRHGKGGQHGEAYTPTPGAGD
ncbi:MAG: polysulfide reductase NrfD [Chloroflexaceae bacterium]|jgi:molybdopterin-containing oxidoreductase family membrane subunit|nr:polysulfide reductase NrfD [Chloroflexaceae bacterium]